MMVGHENLLPYRRVLVTGGTGFVGSHLVTQLRRRLAQDAQLFVLGRTDGHVDIVADLNDRPALIQGVERAMPDLIVHLAGEASVAAADGAAETAWRSNLVGSLDLAACCASVSPRLTFLFVSSADVYGKAFLDGEVTETTLPQPISVYAQSKYATEQMLASVLPPESKLIIARPSNHIGIRQSHRFAIPSFARQIVEAEKAGSSGKMMVGNLDVERDFMDVRDVVNAYLSLLALPLPMGSRQTVNIASGKSRSVRSLLDRMTRSARVPVTIAVDPGKFRPAEVRVARVNSQKIRDITNWVPEHSMDKAVEEILEYWRTNFV